MRRWDVSGASRWQTLIGQEITGVQMGLAASGVRPAEVGSAGSRAEISGWRCCLISALEIEPGREPFGHTDTITVVFDEPTARRYGVGPFARTQNTFPGG